MSASPIPFWLVAMGTIIPSASPADLLQGAVGVQSCVKVSGPATIAPIEPVPPPAPTGSTWTVGTLGGEDFPDLATAIASGSVLDGDRLLLSAEPFTLAAGVVVNKSITIQGAGIASTVIQGAGGAGDPVVLLDLVVSDVVLRDLTVKQRKTTNTTLETAINISAGPSSAGIFVEAVRVETMQSGIVVRSDGWQVNNCELAYVGPNNPTRELLAIYRSDGIGLFTNSTYDSGQDGVITGSTRLVVVTTITAPFDEVLGGYLRIGNVTPANGYPLGELFNVNHFGLGLTPLRLMIDGTTANDQGAFVVFFLPGPVPPLGRCEYIAIQGCTLTNAHGKGAVALDGAIGFYSAGATTFYASGNTIASPAFAGGWASGIDPLTTAAVDAQLGYNTAVYSDPNQPIASLTGAVFDVQLSPEMVGALGSPDFSATLTVAASLSVPVVGRLEGIPIGGLGPATGIRIALVGADLVTPVDAATFPGTVSFAIQRKAPSA